MIEGNYDKGDKVMVVDDTCTTGGSVLFAAKIMEEAGCEVELIRCVLDRVEGGKENITKAGYNFDSLLRVDGKRLI